MSAKKSSKNKRSGSLENSEPDFLMVGRIQKPHGIYGYLKFISLTDVGGVFEAGRELYVGPEKEQYELDNIREAGNKLIIRFKELNNREAAQVLTNQYAYIRKQDLPELVDGMYYQHELIGLDLLDEAGEKLGKINAIISTGSNDVYVVSPVGKSLPDILVPAISSVVIEINLDRGFVKVELPEYY